MLRAVLIRGLPGSGKSTLAQNYVRQGCVHIEADQFRYDESGTYQFSPETSIEAHRKCRQWFATYLANGVSVVVANTFVTRSEMQPYITIAAVYGAHIEVITANGDYPNIHGVPPEAIERMKAKWEQ